MFGPYWIKISPYYIQREDVMSESDEIVEQASKWLALSAVTIKVIASIKALFSKKKKPKKAK